MRCMLECEIRARLGQYSPRQRTISVWFQRIAFTMALTLTQHRFSDRCGMTLRFRPGIAVVAVQL